VTNRQQSRKRDTAGRFSNDVHRLRHFDVKVPRTSGEHSKVALAEPDCLKSQQVQGGQQASGQLPIRAGSVQQTSISPANRHDEIVIIVVPDRYRREQLGSGVGRDRAREALPGEDVGHLLHLIVKLGLGLLMRLPIANSHACGTHYANGGPQP
jgi:hypothetical protein